MTTPSQAATSSSHMTPSRPNPESESNYLRPRNRRIATADRHGNASNTRQSSPGSRNVSPGLTSGRTSGDSRADRSGAYFGRGLLESSWTSGWATVQGLAASFLTGNDDQNPAATSQLDHSGRRPGLLVRDYSVDKKRTGSGAWGPAPPPAGPRSIAADSLASRESALKAARTASVLESHEGVNGGLDISGRFKKKNSDEFPRSETANNVSEEQLVYIHHVQPTDTYAGIILRYRCREDIFKRINGLWSTGDIQVRKWLAIPVDACDVRGKPCEPPSYYSTSVDLLAATPAATSDRYPQSLTVDGTRNEGDFFTFANGSLAEEKTPEDESRPWTSVRWVAIEGFPSPVEIARLPRRALGFFPPRRKKSLHTMSSMSSPRQSMDRGSPAHGVPDAADLHTSSSSRGYSTLSNRPNLSGSPISTRSGPGKDEGDGRPVWMRRPGGVGSMGRSVRAPGPERDYLNSWAKKHLPGLNIESLPSMSVMGSETASFGFGREPAVAGLVEAPFHEGQDTTLPSRNGSGLDRAAATIENWVRGALSNVKKPSTPIMGPRRPILDDSDLIELADTNSDDGRLPYSGGNSFGASSLLNDMTPAESSSRDRGGGTHRSRSASSAPVNKKAD